LAPERSRSHCSREHNVVSADGNSTTWPAKQRYLQFLQYNKFNTNLLTSTLLLQQSGRSTAANYLFISICLPRNLIGSDRLFPLTSVFNLLRFGRHITLKGKNWSCFRCRRLSKATKWSSYASTLRVCFSTTKRQWVKSTRATVLFPDLLSLL